MSYWQDRMALAQATITNKGVKAVERQLKRYYAAALERTIADFENTYEKLLATAAEGKQPTPADLYRLDRYWQMQAQLRKELQLLGDKQITSMSKIFELNFFDVYYSYGLEGATAFNTISAEGAQQLINQIWAADGKSWSQRIWENTELLAETLNEELLNCIITGQKPSALKKRLQERFNVSYSRADTLARTELAHIQTQAAKQRYEDYGLQEVEIWADKDERRCDVCGKLHQKRYPIGAAVPIPAHPNCRCCILPVVKN